MRLGLGESQLETHLRPKFLSVRAWNTWVLLAWTMELGLMAAWVKLMSRPEFGELVMLSWMWFS